MPLETFPLDPADLLDTTEVQIEYLALALETGDAAEVAHALRSIARARGVTQLAVEAGLSQQGLRKALSEDGDPKLSTLLDVAKALGFRMTMVPAAE